MDYVQVLEGVEIAAGVTRERAAEATIATLATLAERITREEARELKAELPRELREALDTGSSPPEEFTANEFIRRVATRESVTPTEAMAHAREVLATLRQDASVLESLRTRLPEDYRPLFG